MIPVRLAYHGIALLASIDSRAKGVCLFSFIVPELELGNIQRKVPFADSVKPLQSAFSDCAFVMRKDRECANISLG